MGPSDPGGSAGVGQPSPAVAARHGGAALAVERIAHRGLPGSGSASASAGARASCAAGYRLTAGPRAKRLPADGVTVVRRTVSPRLSPVAGGPGARRGRAHSTRSLTLSARSVEVRLSSDDGARRAAHRQRPAQV